MPIFELTDACSVHIARSTLEQPLKVVTASTLRFIFFCFFFIYSEMYPAVVCVSCVSAVLQCVRQLHVLFYNDTTDVSSRATSEQSLFPGFASGRHQSLPRQILHLPLHQCRTLVCSRRGSVGGAAHSLASIVSSRRVGNRKTPHVCAFKEWENILGNRFVTFLCVCVGGLKGNSTSFAHLMC